MHSPSLIGIIIVTSGLLIRPAICPAATVPICSSGNLSHAQARAQGGAVPALQSAQSTWVLSNTVYQPLSFVQQPFVGNGYLGLRIPAIGQGYQGGNLGKSGFPLFNGRYTSALVAGVYESTKGSDYIASLPTWSEMDLVVAGRTLNAYTPPSQISDYQQELDMRDGVVTTALTWTPVPGRAVRVCYALLANRARMHLGEVKLTFQPSWSGSLSLDAIVNGRGAERITPISRHADPARGLSTVVLETPGRNTVAAEAQILVAGPSVVVENRSAVAPTLEKSTVGTRWVFPVVTGRSYRIVKYVGISSSNDSGSPKEVAFRTARAAARSGWRALLEEQERAWKALWAGDIRAPRGNKLEDAIHSSFYLLYSSIRAGLAWSIPPTGLSSDNYGGEIFWDADTWMFPTLLTFQPGMAKSIVDFRYDTRAAAEANAAKAGYKGAMWAWDNGPTGTCGGLAPCSHYEDHLQSDIALAQWQYYEATGDRNWLARRGYPVMKEVAEFWVSRVRLGLDGKYHIDRVTGPDEFTANVNDESATNAGAIVALRDTIAAAKALGLKPNPKWSTVADNIYVAVDADGSHPEYAGYTNETVKQADTVLMTYPYGYVTDPGIAAKDLNRYMPVTDPGGPAMTASVEGIIAAQIRQPGCLDFTLLENSYRPFLRGAYEQFLETQYLIPSARQGPPAFSFATGAGGFLQMFPFGFAGLRWSPSALKLDPTLPPQLDEGITLRGIHYHGRSLTIAIRPRHTIVTLNAGAPIEIQTPGGALALRRDRPVQIPTFQPDLESTHNLALCRPVTASSAAPVNPPVAAVDGNPVTNWQATLTKSSFQITLVASGQDQPTPIETSGAVIHWGATRPASFTASVENLTGEWRQVASGAVSGGTLNLRWPETPSRSIRLSFRGGSRASITEIDVPADRKTPHSETP